MPDPTTDTDAAKAAAAAAAATGKPAEKHTDPEGHADRFTPAQWLERTSWLKGKHKRHALAGAFAGLPADATLTQVEAQKALDKFGGRS